MEKERQGEGAHQQIPPTRTARTAAEAASAAHLPSKGDQGNTSLAMQCRTLSNKQERGMVKVQRGADDTHTRCWADSACVIQRPSDCCAHFGFQQGVSCCGYCSHDKAACILTFQPRSGSCECAGRPRLKSSCSLSLSPPPPSLSRSNGRSMASPNSAEDCFDFENVACALSVGLLISREIPTGDHATPHAFFGALISLSRSLSSTGGRPNLRTLIAAAPGPIGMLQVQGCLMISCTMWRVPCPFSLWHSTKFRFFLTPLCPPPPFPSLLLLTGGR